MENATKALIMAATILIGIAIISLGLFLATSMGSYASEVEKENQENQLAQFNSQFTKYNGRNDLTIYDIITVANLAKENNEQYDLTKNDANENTLYIQVYVQKLQNGTSYTNFENDVTSVANDSDIMSKEIVSGDLAKYKCTVSISDVTKRVYKVIFNKT